MTKLKKTAAALQDADAVLTKAALPYRHTPAIEAISWLSEIGDQPQMRALCGGVIGLGLLRRDRKLVRTGARMLAAHTLATWLKNQVKQRVDRTRPRSQEAAADLEAHRIKPGRSSEKEETSFPSGHSAGAAAVARVFARDYPEYAVPAYAGGAFIALAQIPRCAHYPTDVGSGLLLGAASEAIVDRFWHAAEENVG
jgi:undecaprenyl-diphosphatase